ncbi:uncharacterized protein PAE49_001331 isoform 1-T1 [Odontesthes bonariensis]|uniref:uncharacterized protein LOC142373446 n=1 Tax=Odontesthes bonariensis TaxID=219752 RepID=UPI003F58FBFB
MEEHSYAAPQEEGCPSLKERKRDLKRERDRLIHKNRVNIGVAFPRWKELMKEKDFQRDAEVACFLLDSLSQLRERTGECALMSAERCSERRNLPPEDPGRLESVTSELVPTADIQEEELHRQEELHVKEEELHRQEELHVKEEEELHVKEEELHRQEELHVKEEELHMQEELHVKEEEEFHMQEELHVKEEELHVKEEELHMQEELHVKEEELHMQEELHVKEEELHVKEEELHMQEELHVKEENLDKNLDPGGHLPHGEASDSSETEVSECEEEEEDWQEPLSDSQPETQAGENGGKASPAPESGENGDVGFNTLRKSFRCSRCGKRFLYKRSLQIHTTSHSGKGSSSCLVDTKSSDAKTRAEAEEKRFVCGQRFTHLTSLQRHMRVHMAEQPFSCDVCGKRFKHHVTLKSHIKLHTGVKPLDCTLCDKRFTR